MYLASVHLLFIDICFSVLILFFLHLKSLFKCSQKQQYVRVQGCAVLLLYDGSNVTGADW